MKRFVIDEGIVKEIDAEATSFNGIITDKIQVLKSNAGFYIGTLYYDEELHQWLPYSRDSEDYYKSFEEAENRLKKQNYKPRIL